MNFTHLRVGTRLTFGFGMVVLLLIGITFLAATRLYSLKHTMGTVIEVRYANVSRANVLQGEINRIAIAMRNALVTEPEKTTAEIEAIKQARKKIDENFLQLEQALRDPEAKSIFEAMKVSREQYRSGQDAFLELIETGLIPDARELLLNTVIQRQRAYLGNVMALVHLNERRMNESSAEVSAQYSSALRIMMSLAGAALVLACGFGYWVSRSITRPLQQAVQVARTVATGDLTSAIDVKSKDETGQLMLALKDMNVNLVRIVSQVRSGTETIATASGQIAVGNQDLSARTEEQAGSLEETASSMEELTSTVRQNADNARQANQLALSASGVAERGGQAMSGVVSTMGEINDSAKKIVEIISVIDSIAFQTNILALNAAVEAARAGEQGRGFAVVATEVRNLAQRSAAAAKDIKTLIGASVEKIGAGTQLVDQAGATMGEVVLSIRRVTDIMQEITAASNEQSAGIEQVNQAIIHMDQATQQNAALVEQAAAAATAMQEQADSLAQMVGMFKFDALQAAASGTIAMAALPSASAPRSKVPAAKLPARAAARIAPVANGSSATDEWAQF